MTKLRAQHEGGVSGPVLHYTNAVQRNDLHNIGRTKNPDQSSPQAVSLWDFPRPRTAGTRTQNKKHPELRIKIPPREVVPLSIHTGDDGNGNTIGIALGSPRLVDRRHEALPLRPQDPYAATAYATATEKPKRGPAPVQRKPSKWRKIGGLFKTNQVRNNRPPQASSHPIDWQYHAEAGYKPKPCRDSGVEDKGTCFGGFGRCLEAKRELKTDPPSKSQQAKGSSESKAADSAPFLEVDLPDVQMERYSVMFAGLFGQGKPALLARRSKTLDGMTAANKESSGSLTNHPRPRRATSPTRSKSPSFNLFPSTHISKASKVLGTSNIPRGPRPLSRSQTLPTEPEQEHLLKVHTPLTSPVSIQSQGSEISSKSTSKGDRKRININIDTQSQKKDGNAPTQSTGDESTDSSPVLSPLDATRHNIDSILSSNNPTSPEPTNETEDTSKTGESTGTGTGAEPFPKIEISVARSVSVSKGKKKQVVVPIGPRPDRLGADENRLLGKKPQVTDAHYGHRHGNSHDVRIEDVEAN